MKKYTPYVAMTLMACFAPLTASPLVEEAPGFWSTLFHSVVEALTPTKLTPENCDIYQANGQLYIKYYYEDGSYSSFNASSIFVTDSGYVSYKGENTSQRPASPFGIMPLMSHDSVYVEYNGFYPCLMLERAGTASKIQAVYADGEKVFVKVDESFDAMDAQEYLYVNSEMLSWDEGVFYVNVYHDGVTHQFSPTAVDIDGNFMYVSIYENNLYVDGVGNFCMGEAPSATMLPSYTYTAMGYELGYFNDTLAIYQNGATYYPHSIYAGGSHFLFD